MRRIEARASRASAKAVELRMVEALVRCEPRIRNDDVQKTIEKALKNGKYNTDLAIEKAHKASALYKASNCGFWNGGNHLHLAARVLGDKAVLLSALIAINSVKEKLKNEGEQTEAYCGAQHGVVQDKIMRYINACSQFDEETYHCDYERDSKTICNWWNS
jgi:hypothetical protein